MAKPPLENIDPLQIFLQANEFHVAEDALGKLSTSANVQWARQLMQPNMVLSALTTELFLKCLVCLETKLTPQGHHLSELFKQLSPETIRQITHLWDTQIVPAREALWNAIENDPSRQKIRRDLPGALLAANRAFEKIRYSYEPGSGGTFYIGDLPRILHRVILQMKPEWANAARIVTRLPDIKPA